MLRSGTSSPLSRSTMTRRHFLSASGALLASSQLSPLSAWGQTPPTADQVVVGKHAGLWVYNSKVGEIETPPALLREHELTPKEILFVRNNQLYSGCMTTQAPAVTSWDIEVTGLVNKPQILTWDALQKLEAIEETMVLQCSGNGRTRFSRAAKIDGAPWTVGAMGNIQVRGVPLAAVCEHLKVVPHSAARFLSAEGRDVPDKPGVADFEHSIPVADAMDRSLLVTHMNGEPLPAVHGGPVRLMTPGYYGTMHVKWVSRIRFEAAESANYHHVPRYRTPYAQLTPGASFDATLDNSEPNWNMKIKSVIFSPDEGQKLRGGQPVRVAGVAWNDGAARITSVDVSADNGQSWRAATLTGKPGRYAWHPWELQLSLPAGKHSLMARATDALGRTQPFDGTIAWNPGGYAWNGVETVTVDVS